MKLTQTPIEGLLTSESIPFSDHRGAFARLFCQEELAEVLADRNIVQVNYSRTTSVGAVRGLHFQWTPNAEMKMVRCIKGRVWDVAVDLRRGSPTFLKYYAEDLSAESMNMMIIPEGFAHGFQVLEEESELLYLHTAFYYKPSELGIIYNDPAIGIDWPLGVTDLSEKDQSHPLIEKKFTGIVL